MSKPKKHQLIDTTTNNISWEEKVIIAKNERDKAIKRRKGKPIAFNNMWLPKP